MNQEKRQAKSSKLGKTFRISLKQLVVLLLIISAVSALLLWASNRTDVHRRWASMLEMSQRFMIHFEEVYVRLPDKFTNEPKATHYWFLNELNYADWSLHKLMKLDEAHANELFSIEDLITTLRDPETNGVRLSDSQFLDLQSTIHDIAQKLPDAYWNPLNSTSVNFDTGPPFWYFGPSPPDEAILQQTATLAIHAKAIISS